MPTANSAAVISSPAGDDSSMRLQRLFEFFQLPWQSYRGVEDIAAQTSQNGHAEKKLALFAPLTSLDRLVDGEGELTTAGSSLTPHLHSAFFYLSSDLAACSAILRKVLGKATLLQVSAEQLEAKVSFPDRTLTGPMEGIRSFVRPRPFNSVLTDVAMGKVAPIISTEVGTTFFALQLPGLLSFITCSSEIVDLDARLKKTWYDVREDFLSVTPLLIYLKWSLRDVSWKANENGACFIVDDPLLRRNYGFCDFERLDQQMEQHAFSTAIAMIPWNNKRTSPAMAKLMTRSRRRLSACIHGCDHTHHEFGTSNTRDLAQMTNCALERMDTHERLTGIKHDRIMIFPQGVFSRESLKVLQEHQFIAAVNTDAIPVGGEREPLTIRDTWNVALLKYYDFPVFTRRYPSHGSENFAFDLLLDRPCLIVEHHLFYKDEHRQVINFITALKEIPVELRWRSLGEVIERCYLKRERSDGKIEVKMFANELLLTNESNHQCDYEIQKAGAASSRVRAVTANDEKLEWQSNGGVLTFRTALPATKSTRIRVEYLATAMSRAHAYTLKKRAKVAARRYLSEFRDNVVSRSDNLMRVARGAKAIVRRKEKAKL